MIGAVNWLATGLGTVAAFMLGYLVYGPALGLQRRWAEGTRIDPEPPASPPLGAMGLQIAALFLLALVIGVAETSDGLMLALLAIAVFAVQAASVGAWAQKSGFAIAVDTGYALGSGIVMILAHAIL